MKHDHSLSLRAARLLAALTFPLSAACGGNVIVEDPPETTPDPCGQGSVLCDDKCADLSNDPQNCGSCGNVCDAGEACVGGGCSGAGCVTCADYITTGANPDGYPPCGLSAQIYDALLGCVCNGACAAQCEDNICTGAEGSDPCLDCVQDPVAGCGDELNECANDF